MMTLRVTMSDPVTGACWGHDRQRRLRQAHPILRSPFILLPRSGSVNRNYGAAAQRTASPPPSADRTGRRCPRLSLTNRRAGRPLVSRDPADIIVPAMRLRDLTKAWPEATLWGRGRAPRPQYGGFLRRQL